MQGYTAQAVATKEQIVITGDVIAGGNERQTLEPLIDKAHQELSQAGVTHTVCRRWLMPGSGTPIRSPG